MAILASSATSQITQDIDKAIGLRSGLNTPGGILGSFLNYAIVLGGFVLFVMLLWGGFEILTGAMDPKKQEAGKQRIMAAAIGFALLFTSYWIAQIVQIVFGINILNN